MVLLVGGNTKVKLNQYEPARLRNLLLNIWKSLPFNEIRKAYIDDAGFIEIEFLSGNQIRIEIESISHGKGNN